MYVPGAHCTFMNDMFFSHSPIAAQNEQSSFLKIKMISLE